MFNSKTTSGNGKITIAHGKSQLVTGTITIFFEGETHEMSMTISNSKLSVITRGYFTLHYESLLDMEHLGDGKE